MKKTALRTALAASLLASIPVLAADQSPPQPAPVKSALFDAIMAVGQEIKKLAGKPDRNLTAQFDRMAKHRFSDATRAKLGVVYGQAEPGSFTRLADVKGGASYLLRLHPFEYLDSTGIQFSWTELSVRMALDKAGRNVTSSGSWPSLRADGKELAFSMNDASLTSDARPGIAGMWLGKSDFRIASIKVEPKGKQAVLALNDIRLTSNATQRGKLVDAGYVLGIRALTVDGEQVDDFRLVSRMTGLDAQAFEELNDAAGADYLPGKSGQERAASMAALIKKVGKSIAKNGSALHIDELSARYRGNKVMLKGKIELKGARDADFNSLAAVSKKIAARFELRVPVALVQDVTRVVARKQMAAQGKTDPDPAAVAQMGQSIADVVVGKLVGGGYARIDKGVLVSVLEFKNGKPVVNGKEITLPKPAANPQPPVALNQRLHAQSLASTDMPAREITDRCKSPPLPAEAQRQRLTLNATASFTVDPAGIPRGVVLTESSNWPEFDQAVLQATEQCRWIPALRNGKEVEARMTRRLSAGLAGSTP